MSRFVVTLSHNEVIEVEADNENEAVHKAYEQAEVDCFWDESDVEEIEEDEEDEED